MKHLMLLAALAALLALAAPADARIARSTAAKHAFMRAHPCPSDKPHTKYTSPAS